MLRRMSTTITTTVASRTSATASRQHYILRTTRATAWRSLSTTPLKPWGQHCVESHGDYTEETWLEDHIGGPLYQHQKQLPRLPVPPIAQSLERLVPTALPLAKSDLEAQNFLEAVKKFPDQAAELQTRLEAHAAANSNTSWLQKWWNQAGYLQVRDTIVVNVSYFFHFADDPTALSPTQRAAALLTACGEFRKLVCSGQLPAETIGRGDKAKILCSTAYKYMFHACRIPLEHQDSYKIFDPSIYHHAIVARKGHFFSIDLIDPETAEPYHVETLESAIDNCMKQAELMGDGPFLGWFTSWNRDDWAKTRKLLLETGGEEMRSALERLESGALLLAMDDDRVVSRAECGEWLLHGGISNGYNRWFDKSVQIIVGANGKAGLQGEHSMMDGMPMVSLADRITKTNYAQCLTRAAPKGSTVVAPIFSLQLLEKIRDTVRPNLEKAKQDFEMLVTNNSLHVQSFQGYGSNFIKQAGYSPDAFVQVAIQIATYRLWGEQAGTYEATQVRPFLHGRTETTRGVSKESAALVKRFGTRPAIDEHIETARQEKLKLLKDAVDAHVKYIGQAAQAQGVDRHFLGLSMVLHESQRAPDLYSDPVFIRSKRWRVSTSHLTHPKFDGWGFGQVVPDGVGIAYSIHPRHCVFNITALRETGWTDKLSQLLEESLLELRSLVEIGMTPKSKL